MLGFWFCSLPSFLTLVRTVQNHPLCSDRQCWSCSSLTHDHKDPWMGISAGFSKPNICASQLCCSSNHSLNQNTKSNFTWMPGHKYLIMAENKSLSFCTASSSCGLLLWIHLAVCSRRCLDGNGSYEFFRKIHSYNQARLWGRLFHRVTRCAANHFLFA